MTVIEKPVLPWSERPVWASVDCGKGWYDIITALDADLREIYPDYRVVQVKEKFGTLRYYIDGVPNELFDAIYARIGQAERESSITCETCSGPGELRNNGWLKTLCDTCQEKWLTGWRPWMDESDDEH
jgi:hypothetical protein